MTITAWVRDRGGLNGMGQGPPGELKGNQHSDSGKGGISYGEGILVMAARRKQLPLSRVQAEEGDPKLEPPNTPGVVPLQQQFFFSLPWPRAVFPRVLYAAGLTLGNHPALAVASRSQELARLWSVPCLLRLLPGWHLGRNSGHWLLCLQPAVLLEDQQQGCGTGGVAHPEDEAEPTCSGGSGHKDKAGKPR